MNMTPAQFDEYLSGSQWLYGSIGMLRWLLALGGILLAAYVL
jgi:hypothetical protein